MELGKICCLTCQVNIIIGNLMQNGYQSLDPGSKVQYLLNSIRYDKLSTAVTGVRMQPKKYEKDFDTVVAFLAQYIDKKGPTLSEKFASITKTRTPVWQKTCITLDTFKGEISDSKFMSSGTR